MSTADDTTTADSDTADTSANGVRHVAREAAGTVATAASDAVSRLPDAAQTTRGAVEEANRAIRAGSDEMLTAGTTLSVGLALGLLLGGANRLLVILALIPAAAMGFTLLDRTQSTRPALKQR
jgi:hypothetical protein